MAHYPFPPDLLVLTCLHVLTEQRDITLVCHHFDDNTWEFLCDADSHDSEDAVIVTISDLCKQDSSLNLICDLPVGACASRKSREYAWEYGRIAGENFYPAAETRMK